MNFYAKHPIITDILTIVILLIGVTQFFDTKEEIIKVGSIIIVGYLSLLAIGYILTYIIHYVKTGKWILTDEEKKKMASENMKIMAETEKIMNDSPLITNDVLKDLAKILIPILIVFILIFTVIIWFALYMEDESSSTEIQNKVVNQNNEKWFTYKDENTGIIFQHPEELNNNYSTWQSKDGSISISINEIPYDSTRSDAGILYEPYQFSQQSLDMIVANPSCEKLSDILQAEEKNIYDENKAHTYLPTTFKYKNSMCDMKKVDDKLIFYTVGLEDDFEGYPKLNSNILILAPDSAYLIMGADKISLYKEKTSKEIDEFMSKYPSTSNGSSEQKHGVELYREYNINRLQNRESDILEQFAFLSEFVNNLKF